MRVNRVRLGRFAIGTGEKAHRQHKTPPGDPSGVKWENQRAAAFEAIADLRFAAWFL